MGKITTIKLEKSTKSRIDSLRSYKRETYDEILQKLLSILNLCRANPEAARGKLYAIERHKRLFPRQKSSEKPLRSSEKPVEKPRKKQKPISYPSKSSSR